MSESTQRGAVFNASPGVFPKEFERNLLAAMDKRFMTILIASLITHVIFIVFFATRPPRREASAEEIAMFQKRFASLVLDRPVLQDKTAFAATEGRSAESPKKSETESANDDGEAKSKKSSANRGGETVEARKAGHGEFSEERRRTREQISREVSNQGILGLLTSTSSSASGGEVQDVLSGGLPSQNLDKALSDVSGLKRAGSGDDVSGSGHGGQRGVRGSRATGGGGIDDLVEGLGKSEAGGVRRSGDLVVSSSTPLLEDDEGNAVKGARDLDSVSEIVKSHNSAIQYCYQRELKRNPNLKGKIVVRFTINAQGAVTQVTILSSTLRSASVEDCIVSRIMRWADFGAIDPKKGDTTIKQVYTFGY